MVAVLAAVVLGFEVPREQGVYSLSWRSTKTDGQWSNNGGSNCFGTNVDGRPSSITAYAPDFVVVPRLAGSFGELVNAAIGTPSFEDQYRDGTARITVSGHLEHGDLPCYLPLFKSEELRGTVTLQTHFYAGGGEPLWSLSCGGSYQLQFTLDASTTGIASCRDLAKDAAAQVAAHIHEHARSVTGR